jgi:hypothetical protein
VGHLHRASRTLREPGLARRRVRLLEHLRTDGHRHLGVLGLPAVGPRDARTRVADLRHGRALEVAAQLDGLAVEALVAGVTAGLGGVVGAVEGRRGQVGRHVLVDPEGLEGFGGIRRNGFDSLEGA